MEFIPIRTEAGIASLAELADEIWHEYWPELIGADQTDYMVDLFQSPEALTTSIHEDGYVYWLLRDGGDTVGYVGVHPEEDTGKLFISKVYLLANARGKGYATRVIAYLNSFSLVNGLKAMYLTVNKGNDMAIRAYKAKGFETVDKVVSDIGNGFVMDDYIMEKVL